MGHGKGHGGLNLFRNVNREVVILRKPQNDCMRKITLVNSEEYVLIVVCGICLPVCFSIHQLLGAN